MCASSSASNPFCLRLDLLPCPPTFDANGAARATGGNDDEDRGVVEPVIQAPAALVGEPEPQVEPPVGERQLVDLESNRQHGCLRAPAQLGYRLRGAREQQTRRVAEL